MGVCSEYRRLVRMGLIWEAIERKKERKKEGYEASHIDGLTDR